MQWPLIPAMTSLSMRSSAVIASSQRIRSGCVSSPAASAFRSTPVWNARPAPVMTTTRTSRRLSSVATASPSSVAKRELPALSTCGRSKVMRATSPRTSSRIVASVMEQWFTTRRRWPRGPYLLRAAVAADWSGLDAHASRRLTVHSGFGYDLTLRGNNGGFGAEYLPVRPSDTTGGDRTTSNVRNHQAWKNEGGAMQRTLLSLVFVTAAV